MKRYLFRYRRNMRSLYIVHGTIWQRVVAWFFMMFNAASIKDKVEFVNGVQFLYDNINPDQLDLPPFVMEYDVQVWKHLCTSSCGFSVINGKGMIFAKRPGETVLKLFLLSVLCVRLYLADFYFEVNW